MRQTRLLRLVLCFSLIIFKGEAQKLWTLNDCIAFALKHSLTEKNKQHSTTISKEQWKQSKRDMFPNISISYPRYNVSYGRTLDRVTNTFVNTRFVSGINGSLSSSITLFQSFRKWHQLAYQKLMYQSSKLDAQQTKYDLAFRIMDLYYQVLYNEGTLSIVKEQQAANLLRKKTVARKVELELAAKADLYEIEATASADALEVLKAENALKATKLTLIQEMNLETQDISIVQGIKSITFSENKESLHIESMYSASQEFLPSLQKSKINVETAKKDLAIKKTALLPSIHLGAGISTNFSDNIKDTEGNTISFRDQIKNNQSQFIGLSLNYPIFGNGRIRSNIKIAKIQLEKAQTQLKIEEQYTYKIIQEVLQKNDALIAEEQLNLKKIKTKEKAYKIAQKKYEKELINLYELQLANNTYLASKIEQIRLMAQIAIQKYTLDFYNGRFIIPTITSSN